MSNSILIHGATNCNSSNYGDYLYVEMLYNHIKDKGFTVYVWQPSSFFENWLLNNSCVSLKEKKKSNVLIYAPGGYFGEGHNAKFVDNVIQFIRFFPIGIIYALKNKKICAISMGAGPNNNFLLKKAITYICKSCSLLTVRDTVSYLSLKKLYCELEISNCFDLIVAPSSNIKAGIISKEISNILKKANNKHILLVHYNDNLIALKVFAKAAKLFIESHPDYFPVITSDNVLKNEDELFALFKKESGLDCELYKYNNPHDLTTMISNVDVVITSKLHVGVVSCMFNKSVVVAASHPEKTTRFYDQIGEKDRCVSLFDTNSEKFYKLIEQYYNEKISIPQKCYMLAEKSWKELDCFLSSI